MPVGGADIPLAGGASSGGHCQRRGQSGSINKADLEALSHCCRDTPEHCERMTTIVGVFETRNNALVGTDKVGELLLSQVGLGSGVVDGLANKRILDRALDGRSTLRISSDESSVEDLDGVRGLASPGVSSGFVHRVASVRVLD